METDNGSLISTAIPISTPIGFYLDVVNRAAQRIGEAARV
jgi:hypothetical protein